MRISISNIAWDPSIDGPVAELLTKHRIDAIDIAPAKYFTNVAHVSKLELEKVKMKWKRFGIDIVGMQALLFGTQGLNMFGSTSIQDKMLNHLACLFRIASELGAKWLVFGSPKNRDRSHLSQEESHSKAVSFFKRAGDLAAQEGVFLCLEPNAPRYGCNFMTDTLETLSVVRAVAHENIRLQIDLGATTLAGESLEQSLGENDDLVGHIHLSEPDLAVLGTCKTDHAAYGRLFQERFKHKITTIEMRSLETTSQQLRAVEHALCFANKNYLQKRDKAL